MWLAAADRRSNTHGDCSAVLRSHHHELAAPAPVIAETSWLILDRLGPRSQNEFLRMITSGRIDPLGFEAADWARCVELSETYADTSLDLMDASIVALAEARHLDTIATLNHRDSTVVRPRHVDPFALVP